MDEAGFKPRTSSATRSAATSPCSWQPRTGARASSRSRRPAAGPRATSRSGRDAPTVRHNAGDHRTRRPHAEALLATPEGRRRATRIHRPPTSSTSRPSCSPTRCTARRVPRPRSRCSSTPTARARASTPSRSRAPCGSSGARADALLPWPSAAARYRDAGYPHADWVELDGDRPLPAARRPARDRAAHPRLHGHARRLTCCRCLARPSKTGSRSLPTSRSRSIRWPSPRPASERPSSNSTSRRATGSNGSSSGRPKRRSAARAELHPVRRSGRPASA